MSLHEDLVAVLEVDGAGLITDGFDDLAYWCDDHS